MGQRSGHTAALTLYKCERCREVIGPRVQQFVVVTQRRHKTYPARRHVNPPKRKKRKKKREWRHDRGGQGREIVKAIKVCPCCNVA